MGQHVPPIRPGQIERFGAEQAHTIINAGQFDLAVRADEGAGDGQGAAQPRCHLDQRCQFHRRATHRVGARGRAKLGLKNLHGVSKAGVG